MSRTFSLGMCVSGAVLLVAAVIPACSASTTSGGDAGPGGGDSGAGGADVGTTCPPPVGCGPATPASTELMTPVVSFKTDVVPIFQLSCSLSSSCHSLKESGPSLLYLGGSLMDPPDPAGALKSIINVKSLELTSMNYVTPGKLDQSYLMFKMDGQICQFTTCSLNPVPTCGQPMPMAGCALEAVNGGPNPRDVVRRWIAQGAQDN